MSEKEVYEIGYLLLPNISEEDVLTEVANVKAILEKQGASFLSGDEPKFINLAYPISKMFGADKQIFEKAYFAWIKFEVEVEKIIALKSGLDKYENIMRFLLIKRNYFFYFYFEFNPSKISFFKYLFIRSKHF
ncbi:30S ribosomal protein S6 [Patescibacteria group bacterium]|nr:30S ribosomal protein S6 [Patescibacteria group bacterium]